MKKYIIFFWIFLFIALPKISASKVVCNYASSEWSDIAITFDLDDKTSPYTIINGTYTGNNQSFKIAILYTGAYWSPMEFYDFLYLSDSRNYDNLAAYYRGENACPSDLYLFPNLLWIEINDSSSVKVNYIGLLSTGNYKMRVGNFKPNFSLQNVNPESNETNIETKVCSYQFNMKNRNLKTDITIIGTDAKAVDRTTIIKPSDFSTDCLGSAYVCVDIERDNLYIAKDKDTMLNNEGDNIFIRTLGSFTSYRELPKSCIGSNNEDKCFDYLDSYHIYCGEISIGETSNIEIGNGGCTFFNDKQSIIEGSDATDTEKYTAYIDLKDYCNIITAKQNYNNNPKSCLYRCLHITDYIDYYPGDIPGECGFSGKLVAWIENILRWVKYIVPVILIVLSILDFIKAIASEKEDEMKKAQKHFTTRLIAAVLIFLMPILIEFILGKMGFDAESCGISNIGF